MPAKTNILSCTFFMAEGKSKRMIIVTPYGYMRQGVNLGPEDPHAQIPMSSAEQTELFSKDLLTDVMPFVEKNFRTLNDADHRAIGGLSMGAAQSIAVGFKHTELFHSFVLLSNGVEDADKLYPSFFANPAATNKDIKFFFLGVGSNDPLVKTRVVALNETLNAKGIHHEYWELPGAVHEWIVWRNGLDLAAPKLFK